MLIPRTMLQRLQNQQLAEQVRTLRSYVDELRAEMAERDAALRMQSASLTG